MKAHRKAYFCAAVAAVFLVVPAVVGVGQQTAARADEGLTAERCWQTVRELVETTKGPWQSPERTERAAADIGLYIGCYSPAQLVRAGYDTDHEVIDFVVVPKVIDVRQ